MEFTQQEEAKHQAALLAAEVEEIQLNVKPKPEEVPGKKKVAETSKLPKPNAA